MLPSSSNSPIVVPNRSNARKTSPSKRKSKSNALLVAHAIGNHTSAAAPKPVAAAAAPKRAPAPKPVAAPKRAQSSQEQKDVALVAEYHARIAKVHDDDFCSFLVKLGVDKKRTAALKRTAYARYRAIAPPTFNEIESSSLLALFNILDDVFFNKRMRSLLNQRQDTIATCTTISKEQRSKHECNIVGLCSTELGPNKGSGSGHSLMFGVGSYAQLKASLEAAKVTRRRHVIHIDLDFFRTKDEGARYSDGAKCETRARCVTLIMLHEMVHLLQRLQVRCPHIQPNRAGGTAAVRTDNHHDRNFHDIIRNLYGATTIGGSVIYEDSKVKTLV